MWWKTVLQVAVMLGLDKWAKKKAKSLVEVVKSKAVAKAKGIMEAAGEKEAGTAGGSGEAPNVPDSGSGL